MLKLLILLFLFLFLFLGEFFVVVFFGFFFFFFFAFCFSSRKMRQTNALTSHWKTFSKYIAQHQAGSSTKKRQDHFSLRIQPFHYFNYGRPYAWASVLEIVKIHFLISKKIFFFGKKMKWVILKILLATHVHWTTVCQLLDCTMTEALSYYFKLPQFWVYLKCSISTQFATW